MSVPPTSQHQTLGPYRLLEVLGEGGMGTVYLALDEPLNRQIAVKVLRADKQKSPAAAQSNAKRFLREAQSAAKLNHPNVVTIFAVGQHAGRSYIAMEYADGGSLAQRLRSDGPLYWRDAARVLHHCLRGLAAAHRAGIVHRDIKPANLMLTRDQNGEETVKLADFGLARVNTLGGQDADLTFPGAFVGSPSYSAPEQIAGSHKIDGRADLYSLGATAYALLTGRPPFVDEDPAEVMDRHLNHPFPDVRALAPTVPKDFQSLLEKAGQKNPALRFQTALDMLKAVDLLLELPADISPAPAPRKNPANIPDIDDSIAELETRLAAARKGSDSSTQLSTLRELYGLYERSRRPEDARRAFREALALHVKLHAPGAGAKNN